MQNPFNVYTRQVGPSLLFFRGKRHGLFSKCCETQLMLSFYQAWPHMEGCPHTMQQDLHLHQRSPHAWDLAAPRLTASQIGIQSLILLLCYRAGILLQLKIEELGHRRFRISFSNEEPTECFSSSGKLERITDEEGTSGFSQSHQWLCLWFQTLVLGVRLSCSYAEPRTHKSRTQIHDDVTIYYKLMNINS